VENRIEAITYKIHAGESTQTADPQDAALFRLQFMQNTEECFEELNSPLASYGKIPLCQVADVYFKQEAIDHADGTIARERRIFRRVEQSFGPDTKVKSIHLWLIEPYQQERSAETSPTIRQKITPRTIHYEIRLLRGVMLYAGCWKGDLAVYYKPLRQMKSQIGQFASDNQLARIIETAKKNQILEVAMYCAAASLIAVR